MATNKLTRFTPIFPVVPQTIAQELGTMRNRLRHFFQEPFNMLDEPLATDLLTQPLGWAPVVEASETPDEFTVTAELPGIKMEDVTVECENGTLMIRGSKKEERKEVEADRKFHLWERSYGEFQRSFTFPSAIREDKIIAEYQNGVLTVHLPKTAEAKTRAKKIAITPKK
jgi:HSP20 family protein